MRSSKTSAHNRSYIGALFLCSIFLALPLNVFAQDDVDGVTEVRPREAPTSPKERFTTTRKQSIEDENGNPIPDSSSDQDNDGGGKVVVAPDRSAKKASVKRGSGGAVVATDGAIVYDKPDQDANVITMLPQGQKVQVSRGTTNGPIPFHKIRVGQKIGYIADIDITTEEAAVAQTAIQKKKSKPVKKDKNGKPVAEKKPKKPKKREPMLFTKFAGFLFGQSQYKEGIVGVDASTTLPIYGIKITGPDVIMKGPITDFSLWIHYGAPSYYGPLSGNTPSGYLIFTDWLLLVPIYHGFNSMVYGELGPLLVYSNFNVFNAGHTETLSQINFGGSLLLGWGIRVDDFAFRLEGKYMFEKQNYGAIQLAVQTGF